jgi:hypothetical protein
MIIHIRKTLDAQKQKAREAFAFADIVRIRSWGRLVGRRGGIA